VSTDLDTARALSAEAVAEITGTPTKASPAELTTADRLRLVADYLDAHVTCPTEIYRVSAEVADVHLRHPSTVADLVGLVGTVEGAHLTAQRFDYYGETAVSLALRGSYRGQPMKLGISLGTGHTALTVVPGLSDAEDHADIAVDVAVLRELAAVTG
jgi:hypothetical protein